MPRYRVTGQQHYIGESLVEPGQVVDYDGVPGKFLEPLDAEAKKRRQQADKEREQRARAVAKGETPEPGRLVDDAPRDRGPQLIKTHPILPNLEGSSGEITGESPIASPEAKQRKADEMAGVAVRRNAARRSKPGRAKRAAKKRGTAADRQPRKAQSNPVASPDEQ